MPTGSEVLAVLEAAANDSPALAVEANLSLTVDGTKLAVSAPTDRLRVQIPSLTAAASLFGSERERAPALSRAMAAAGVTAEIRIGDAVVAVLGEEALPDPVTASLFGEGVEFRPGGVLAAALRFR